MSNAIHRRVVPLLILLLICVFAFILIRQSPMTHYNVIDGYSITLPANMKKDDSLAGVRTVYSSDHVSLSIYAEPCENEEEKAIYVGYSNRFLQNSEDFDVIQNEVISLGSFSANLARWNRDSLKIPSDENHYACYDIDADTNCIYTLMFKYDDTVDFESDIVPVANSFSLCNITKQADTPLLGTTPAPQMNTSASEAFDTLFSEDASLTWGLYSYYAVHDHSVVDDLEKKLDYSFPVLLLYSQFDNTPVLNGKSLYDALCIACPEGQIPELTLQTVDDQQGNMLLRTLAGEFDEFLRDYAKQVAAFGKPVLFRLANEMNGDWCVYSAFHYCRDPDLYVEFYRYVFDIFQQEGADNCIWVWNPNYRSFPNFKWNSELMYYPGDAYVNVVGLTAYNTGNYYEGEYWNSFNALYKNLYHNACSVYSQPLMITEFACSSIGGNKPAWITDMFQSIADYPRIKVAVWWNGCDMDTTGTEPIPARPYFLDETDTTTQAFRNGLHTSGS